MAGLANAGASRRLARSAQRDPLCPLYGPSRRATSALYRPVTVSANSQSERVIALFKTELIRREGPWRGNDNVDFATLEWVVWYNTCRLLEPLGCLPPAENGAQYYHDRSTRLEPAGLD